MNRLLDIYYKLFAKQNWQYNEFRTCRTCPITGVTEWLYGDDWGNWWDAPNKGEGVINYFLGE